MENVAGEKQKKKISNKVLRQAKKQTVYIPKLVAELENFVKCVTQLSVKCKVSRGKIRLIIYWMWRFQLVIPQLLQLYP